MKTESPILVGSFGGSAGDAEDDGEILGAKPFHGDEFDEGSGNQWED